MRLTQLLTGSESLALPHTIAEDMSAFLSDIAVDPVNLKQIGIPGVSMQDILEVLTNVYENEG